MQNARQEIHTYGFANGIFVDGLFRGGGGVSGTSGAYPGNYENDIRMLNKKQGVREVFVVNEPKLIDFYGTKEFEKIEKEADLNLKTGGES